MTVPPLRSAWRVHPADKPEETLADLVFTQPPDADTGSLAITGDPAMRSLLLYFLLDPYGHRPLFFRDTGTIQGPHLYTFGQIDRSLLDFNRQYPAFRAERVAEPPR